MAFCARRARNTTSTVHRKHASRRDSPLCNLGMWNERKRKRTHWIAHQGRRAGCVTEKNVFSRHNVVLKRAIPAVTPSSTLLTLPPYDPEQEKDRVQTGHAEVHVDGRRIHGSGGFCRRPCNFWLTVAVRAFRTISLLLSSLLATRHNSEDTLNRTGTVFGTFQ